MTHSDNDGILDQYKYEYDLMGNKTGIDKYRRGLDVDNGQFGYGYDALGRLCEVVKDGEPVRSYTYDAFGNRSLMSEGDKQTSYTFNALNQLIRAESPDITRNYLYDARGNINRTLENGLLKKTYEFGALNKLEKTTNVDGQATGYKYNGLGFRVGEYIADANFNPLKEIDYVIDFTKQYRNILQRTENNNTRNYLWDHEVVSESSNEGDNFYLLDELGSPLRFVDANGVIADSYAHDEFGNDLTGNQGIQQPFGYTGYRYDNLAGMYFAQSREYDPWLGRFASEDRFKDGKNWYCYCNNNPCTFVDLSGNAWEHADGVNGTIAHKQIQAFFNFTHPDAALRTFQEFTIPSVIDLISGRDVLIGTAKVAGTAATGWLIWEICKWAVAGGLAPFTGGASIGVAVCMP